MFNRAADSQKPALDGLDPRALLCSGGPRVAASMWVHYLVEDRDGILPLYSAHRVLRRALRQDTGKQYLVASQEIHGRLKVSDCQTNNNGP